MAHVNFHDHKFNNALALAIVHDGKMVWMLIALSILIFSREWEGGGGVEKGGGGGREIGH